MYQPNRWYLNSGHVQTILASIIKIEKKFQYTRERLVTSDGDFIDLDCVRNGHKRAVVIVHGLGSNSNSNNVVSLINGLSESWDCIAVNLRGCGGEPNRKKVFYNTGQIGDIRDVIESIQNNYKSISMVGFSLGGNLLLNFLGRLGAKFPKIKCAVGISVPIDLTASSKNIEKQSNRLYLKKYLSRLKRMVLDKIRLNPELKLENHFDKIKTIYEYDRYYTISLNGLGYQTVDKFYAEWSSINVLTDIHIPVLMISSKDDPLLSEKDYPYDKAEQNKDLVLIITKKGGHIGFLEAEKKKLKFWYESIIIEYLEDHCQ